MFVASHAQRQRRAIGQQSAVRSGSTLAIATLVKTNHDPATAFDVEVKCRGKGC